MSSKKLSTRQLKKKKIIENRKFNKTMLVSFSLVFLLVILILLLIYWCDVRYTYRKYDLYSKTVPNELVCISHNNLQYHKSYKVLYKNNSYYICGHDCHQHLINHFREVAFAPDAFSGDTICKANAFVGLKEKGEPKLVYFKNKQNLKKYYETKSRQ